MSGQAFVFLKRERASTMCATGIVRRLKAELFGTSIFSLPSFSLETVLPLPLFSQVPRVSRE